MSKTPTVVMYTTPTCPYCHAAKALLDDKGVAYEEINVARNPARRREMAEKSNGRRTVPQVFIDQHHIGGFDDLARLEGAGQLDALLGRQD